MTDVQSRLNSEYLVLHEHYQETMESMILPTLSGLRRNTRISGADGKPVSVDRFDAERSRGTVVIVHGFTENAFKYSEIIYSLLMNHYSVIAYDQRGHGYSWRKEGLADPSVTHVERFEEYVEDLDAVCTQVLSVMPKPWLVFCHSMGGAVTALYLERQPTVFSRAVMSAPMIAPNLSGIPVSIAKGLCLTARFFHCGRQRLMMSRPYSGPEDFETSCATDPDRFAWYDAVKAAHPEYHNCSPTYGWTLEAIRVTEKILAPGAPEKISCPVLLFTADQDFSVMPAPQKQFISRVKNGRHLFVSRSRHEIYRSTDDVLFPWWHTVLMFLAESAPSEGGSGE